MKEIVITKERSNDKFQEFRRMILENLAVVLKIICGDKFLIHKFDTKDYMDYEPKFVTKEEYAMNMVERDLHEVYNIMTQGYIEVCNGGSIEKRYLTDKYNVSTIVSTETKTKNNTQEIKMKDGKEKMVRNVRVLEESVEKGLLQGYALESAKQTLEKIDHRTTGVDTWVLENNEGTYGTEIVITKDGHIDLYLCIMEKYASRVSYIRVGNFQPEYELGDVWLPNGKVKEYQKLGTIINALNKEYEKYGFYFTADTKNNRRILADARKSYELFKAEEKERKRKENLVKDLVSLSGSTLAGLLKELGHEGRVFYEDIEELERELVKFFEKSDKKYDCWQDVFADYKENYLEVERLKKNLVKKEQELLSKEVTFDIDGEGKVEEIKDASYADANENYKRRRYQAPEKGNGYNKTYVTMKLDGKKFHDMVICLHGETEHHNLKDAILAQIKVLRKTWVEGDGVPYFKPEKNKEIIEKKYGSKEKLAIVLDAKEMVVENIDTTPVEEKKELTEFEHIAEGIGAVVVDERLETLYCDARGEDASFNVAYFVEKEDTEQLICKVEMDVVAGHGEMELTQKYIDMLNRQDRKEIDITKVEYRGYGFWLKEKLIDLAIENHNYITVKFYSYDEMVKILDALGMCKKWYNDMHHRPEPPTPEPEEVVVEKRIEKMEEKQMNTINKNALTNRMTKLGEFLKENRDKDAVENKVLELFPKAMEVEVFEGDNVVYFLVGQDYVGKAPTKKEMKELDFEFGELNRMYGLSVHVTVNSEKITMNANVGVEYTDRYRHSHYTDYVVKEMEIELELTMEVAKELTEEIKNKHSNGDICHYSFHEEVECSPEPEETDELEKNIKDHINSVLDLMDNIEKEKFEYMYKKTVAVKRKDRYELTSSLEDVWTGLTVYVGDSSNVLMIPNSEKSFLTDIVEDFLCSNIGINETVEKIKEKIKRKFEYSYSKSVTVKEEEIYVLETPSGVELFWYYKDAYSRMVELVNEMSERFSNNYEVIIEDYSARMETFSWRIIEKNIK